MNPLITEQNAVSTYPFTLTEDQEQLRKEIRDFAVREIAPNVMRWDEASEFPADAREATRADGSARNHFSG